MKYGVNDTTIHWMSSYLTGRVSRVRVGDHFSAPYVATSGVPQGSHLGPILFLVYTQDLTQLLNHVSFSLFADDVKVYSTVKSVEDCERLQSLLMVIHKWGELNRLRLNADKCQIISFSRARSKVLFDYSINGVALKRVDCVKDLGLHLDDKLDFQTHINHTISRCRIALSQVKRFAREFNDLKVTKVLFCALVRSHLDYCAPVWCPYRKYQVDRIESIQKQFLLFALGRHRLPNSFALPPYRDRLRILNLPTIADRHNLSCVMMVYDSLLGHLDSMVIRNSIVVNVGRRCRNTKYLREDQHRTDYGKFEPINKGVLRFNKVSAIFFRGFSRCGFKKAVLSVYNTNESLT